MKSTEVLAEKQMHRSMEQNQEPRNKPEHIWSTNIWQGCQEYPVGERNVSPRKKKKNMLRKLGNHMQEWDWIPILHYSQKWTWNGVKT